ncbi:MAG: dihydrolipoyl dehydrogenase [Phycisphaerae bacterium]|nr:dihydrolipoyl dehydrogenase [Phycisphaerae bacterium]NIW98815.1 dihydrolipoyl dehydrogenase [Phycisphaerae bacterium]NIX27568.1 dihydrolipoyl dehydrogenase [Phycisphaerae bacterium]
MDNQPSSTEVAVIGAGPGGYAAAFLAADLGMQVTLIDPEENPGGVCLYRGCIPSKALLHVAKLLSEAEEAKNWGIEYSEPKINLDKLRSWKNTVVNKLTGGVGQLSKHRKVNYIQGRAIFSDARNLEIDDVQGKKHKLSFDYAIIGTGSRPATIPQLSLNSPRVLNSTSALEIEDIPKSLLVVGGGYIGLEMGSVYAALGSKITVVEMLSGLLPGADRDLVKVLHKRLEAKFSSIMLNTQVVEMRELKDGIKVTFEGEKVSEAEQKFEKVIVSIGRTPNSSGLGLENTHVKINDNGFIEVDEQRRTAEHTIFAIGDVAGEPMLAHKASHEGRIAAEVIAGHKVAFEARAIPAVVFTDPEVAWCGLTETEAKEQERPIEVARFPWAASGRALTMDRTDGVTKLIFDPDTEQVLGMGIAGPGAGELIAEGVLAIEMGALATDIKLSIHPHPTLSETVMESAEVLFGQATHIYRPKRG